MRQQADWQVVLATISLLSIMAICVFEIFHENGWDRRTNQPNHWYCYAVITIAIAVLVISVCIATAHRHVQ